jgi:hypothetical protein
MEIPMGPVQDLHLSAPATIAYQYDQQIKDERLIVELLIMAAYQPSYG